MQTYQGSKGLISPYYRPRNQVKPSKNGQKKKGQEVLKIPKM